MIDENLAPLIDDYFESGAAKKDMEATMRKLLHIQPVRRDHRVPVHPIGIPMRDKLIHTEQSPLCSDHTCPCWENFEHQEGWEWSDSANTFVRSVLSLPIDLDARLNDMLDRIYDASVEF